MPKLVFVELDPDLARSEPDPEIQELIRASAGLNLALDFLPGATTFDPIADQPDAITASSIVWLGGFASNDDRTPRNSNMRMWHRRLWLIDHGAAFYFHHAGGDYGVCAQDSFARIADHVLLPFANALADFDVTLSARLGDTVLRDIVGLISDVWLVSDHSYENAVQRRTAYLNTLLERMRAPRHFVEEAIRARSQQL